MSDEQIFWFILAMFNLTAGVFSILYYRNYYKEIAMILTGFVFILYSVAFILTAGILKAPEPWRLLSVIILMGSFPPLIVLLWWRVWHGDNE